MLMKPGTVDNSRRLRGKLLPKVTIGPPRRSRKTQKQVVFVSVPQRAQAGTKVAAASNRRTDTLSASPSNPRKLCGEVSVKPVAAVVAPLHPPRRNPSRLKKEVIEPSLQDKSLPTNHRRTTRSDPPSPTNALPDDIRRRAEDLATQERGLKRKRMEYDEDVLSFQGKQKIALETLEEREQTLKGLEDALRKKDEELNGEKGILQQLTVELERREAAIAVREEQSTLLSTFAQIENADRTLKRLEDIFSCSLCFDVMACPYSLASPRCGHSFCAMCILQWFFSGLHRGCGGWHEDPVCPLCRAVLPAVPLSAPRNIDSCPFTPNRLADEIIQQYLNELASVPALPDQDGSTIDQNTAKGKGKGKSFPHLKKRRVAQPEDEVVAWREGGSARRDWLERERIGKAKMEYLTSNWVALFQYQFIEFKDSLGA